MYAEYFGFIFKQSQELRPGVFMKMVWAVHLDFNLQKTLLHFQRMWLGSSLFAELLSMY